MSSAIVFAYHNVGIRCLSVLLEHGVDVKLVLTHEDNPSENIWFGNVDALANLHSIPVIKPDNPNSAEILEQIAALEPDFLFSFYYRHMLAKEILRIPRYGAFNMHGSLLPKYRGRVPVNWAIIKGEKITGATLHEMVEKPDAGQIAGQQAVPILGNDTAQDVFNKVTVAAELVLNEALPKLISGTIQLTPQDLTRGSYFGGRKPADGTINWQDSAENIHNLVRAVAPPYPGASTTINNLPVQILRTYREKKSRLQNTNPHLYVKDNTIFACCGDGKILRILTAQYGGETLSAEVFQRKFGLSVQLV